MPDAAKDERAASPLEIMHRNVGRLNSLVVKVVREEVSAKTKVNERVERREVNLWALAEASFGVAFYERGSSRRNFSGAWAQLQESV